MAGPFVAVVDVSSLKPGLLAATVAGDQQGVVAQEVTLEKKSRAARRRGRLTARRQRPGTFSACVSG